MTGLVLGRTYIIFLLLTVERRLLFTGFFLAVLFAMLVGFHLEDAKTLSILFGVGSFFAGVWLTRGPVRNMACRRFCLCLARFGPFACRCLFSYEVDFAVSLARDWRRDAGSREPVDEMVVSDAAAFLMTLSSVDLSNILMEPHLSFWEKCVISDVTMTPDLWRLSDLVYSFSRDQVLFGEMDELCGSDPVECVYAFVCNCERPLRASTFVGALGWLARKCRVEVDGKLDRRVTKAACDAVACVLSPCLAYLR